ncbi:hypothetical protein CEXT_701281 [Caerostris extrusa]|uniref:SAP domain-containing protein n=1 Tax=Caerostris extrusa TaxID=172846 RepID=A0AAV4MEU5_CAEEX|nr:hypothetical protein CEXT_701281 [Caerostris extrusa]
MLHVAYEILNEASDIYTQKCCIPSSILKCSNINSLDVVCINISKCTCICRVFPLACVDPQSYISFDDTVSFTSTERRKFSNFECMSLVFPDDIILVKPITFKKLQLSLGIPTLNQRKEILKSVTKFHHSDEIDYEKIAA